MKNLLKHFGIIVITTIIAFSLTVCGGEDDDTKKPADDGLPSAGDGSINFSTAKTYQVMTFSEMGDEIVIILFNGSATFTHFFGNVANDPVASLVDCFVEGDYEVKITNGTLSLKLGTPKPETLIDASELFTTFETTSTDGLKILCIVYFYGDNNLITWQSDDNSSRICLLYANKKGKIQFEEDYNVEENYTYKLKIDLDLKSGWNTIIETHGDTSHTLVAGKPGNEHKWFIH